MVRYCLASALAMTLAGCDVMSVKIPQKPAPALPIEYVVDLQPVFVTNTWKESDFQRLADRLGPAFAQAGIAFRVLEPVYMESAQWSCVDNVAELREMTTAKFKGIPIYLVRELYSDNGKAVVERSGLAFIPPCDRTGCAISLKAMRDVNSLVHELGHVLGLDHPEAGVYSCDDPEVACSFMSYCYSTRCRFTDEEIETLRDWAAVFSAE